MLRHHEARHGEKYRSFDQCFAAALLVLSMSVVSCSYPSSSCSRRRAEMFKSFSRCPGPCCKWKLDASFQSSYPLSIVRMHLSFLPRRRQIDRTIDLKCWQRKQDSTSPARNVLLCLVHLAVSPLTFRYIVPSARQKLAKLWLINR